MRITLLCWYRDLLFVVSLLADLYQLSGALSGHDSLLAAHLFYPHSPASQAATTTQPLFFARVVPASLFMPLATSTTLGLLAADLAIAELLV